MLISVQTTLTVVVALSTFATAAVPSRMRRSRIIPHTIKPREWQPIALKPRQAPNATTHDHHNHTDTNNGTQPAGNGTNLGTLPGGNIPPPNGNNDMGDGDCDEEDSDPGYDYGSDAGDNDDEDCDDGSDDGSDSGDDDDEDCDDGGSGSGGNNGPPTCSQTAISTPSTLAPGTITGAQGCSAYYTVQAGNTCDSIITATNSTLTLAGFKLANPGIVASCTNLQPGQSVCTAGPALLQFGSTDLDDGCSSFYCVVQNDDCIVVANKLANNVTTADSLIALNPEFGPLCHNMWLGSWICATGTNNEAPPSSVSAEAALATAPNNYGDVPPPTSSTSSSPVTYV